MDSSDGFIPIVAIFYAVFHPTEGTKIVHQVPEGSISTVKENNSDSTFDGQSSSLFNFNTIKNYIIPKPQLCNKLISVKIGKFKVIGYPVNIENPNYSRNSFNFNFCFVFPYDLGDVTVYEMSIRRMGRMFRVLEEQNYILSKLDKDNSFFKDSKFMSNPSKPANSIPSSNMWDFSIDPNFLNVNSRDAALKGPYVPESNPNTINLDNTPGHSRTKKITLSSIESLIHQIYQDLNNYSECCIPLDSANSVDIKLFPILPPPINIKAYQVPIASVSLKPLVDVNWDPTMIKILPYINGINSIRKISELADANYLLTKQCIQHLMHYKCIEITDIFQFSNIYAPTNNIGDFLNSNGRMAEECQAYVITNVSKSKSNYDSMVATPMSSGLTPNSSSPVPTKSNPMNQFVSGRIPSGSPMNKSSYMFKSPKTPTSAPNSTDTVTVPFKTTLFYLYRSLNQGQTVKEWYIQNRKLLENIDVRRFIHFGVLRGIIYRVFSYPILNSIVRVVENGDTKEYEEFEDIIRHRKKGYDRRGSSKFQPNSNNLLLKTRVNERTLKTGDTNARRVSFGYKREVVSQKDLAVNDDSVSDGISTDADVDEAIDDKDYSSDERGHRTHSRGSKSTLSTGGYHRSSSFTGTNEEAIGSDESGSEDLDSDELDEQQQMINLIKMLKGYQHYDSICTELQKSRADVEKMIESLGSYSVVNS